MCLLNQVLYMLLDIKVSLMWGNLFINVFTYFWWEQQEQICKHSRGPEWEEDEQQHWVYLVLWHKFFHMNIFHHHHKDEEAEETSVLYRWSYTEFYPAPPPLPVLSSKHLDHFMVLLFHILPPVIILKWQLGGKREKKIKLAMCLHLILSTSHCIYWS